MWNAWCPALAQAAVVRKKHRDWKGDTATETSHFISQLFTTIIYSLSEGHVPGTVTGRKNRDSSHHRAHSPGWRERLTQHSR